MLILIYSSVFGQTYISISGKITGGESHSPLAYATVSIMGKPIGVVSNDQGEFTFAFDPRYAKDTLIVSILGYHSYHWVIDELPSTSNLKIHLEEKTTLLSEVLIEDKEVRANEIVKKAIDNIRLNYPQETYVMEGFYRHYKKEDEKYIGLLEAAVSIFDNGYPSSKRRAKSKEDIFINEIRKSKLTNYKAKIYTKLNLLDGLLSTNDVRHITHALDLSKNNYELEKYEYIDDRLIYVIKTDPPWCNRIYIDTKNFAVIKIEMYAEWSATTQNQWHMEDSDSIMNRTPFIRKTLLFKAYQNRYFLEYLNYSWQIEGFKMGSNNILFTSDFFQELIINKITTEELKRPNAKYLMNADSILDLQKRPYNELFWQQYNIIKDSPLNDQITRDLEAEYSLEDQFRKNDIKFKDADAKKSRKKRN